VYAGALRDVPDGKPGFPAVRHLRDGISEPRWRISRHVSNLPSGDQRDEVDDVVVVYRKSLISVQRTRDEPKERFRYEAVVEPPPFVCARWMLDEIGEYAVVDREPSCEGPTGPEFVGVHNAGVLHHDAQRRRVLDSVADALSQVSAENDRYLQLIVRVRSVSRAGRVWRRDEAEG
jgi:hypothetical protein